MNIFVTNRDPNKSAEYLAQDKIRLNKQILETTQLINNAFVYYGVPDNFRPLSKDGNLYKITHINHPITKWICGSVIHLMWCIDFYLKLCDIYYYKNNKSHFCSFSSNRIYEAQIYLYNKGAGIREYSGVEFCNCNPYKDLPVFEAYKKHLADKWKKE